MSESLHKSRQVAFYLGDYSVKANFIGSDLERSFKRNLRRDTVISREVRRRLIFK
jgi:hypothetical protein